MHISILDAGIGSVSGLFGRVVIILLVVILIEALVMFLFKLNKVGKVFLHSAFVNIVSTIIGFIMLDQIDYVGTRFSGLSQWFIFYAATVLIEGLLLMLLYSKTPKQKIWLVAAVMNLSSYLFLYFISLF
ncbi:MAG TPA: hypothetical protein VET23_13030 [Chitinophagaceae bacterium]|nr:hypothetical protein [Chitinophagaceae bacterium]